MSFKNSYEKFFDKNNGEKVELTEFPFLFAMMNYSGWSGVLLSATWFGILFGFYPAYFNSTTSSVAAVVCVGFGLMTILSTMFGQAVVDSRFDHRRTADGWDRFARSRMAVLLILFAVTSSALIWITGGMFSPFTPFYIMVFTLALTRCKVPHPGTALLFLFLLPFGAAGLLAEFGPKYLDPLVTAEIKRGNPKDYIDFFFAITSMLVPYGSTYFAAARAERQKQAAEQLASSSAQSTPGGGTVAASNPQTVAPDGSGKV